MKHIQPGLTLVSLILLSGCSATSEPRVIVKTEYHKQSVPELLTQDTQLPLFHQKVQTTANSRNTWSGWKLHSRTAI
ncbi:hypothetical protein P4S72_03425 [Vibrio sp. PP-XX7]